MYISKNLSYFNFGGKTIFCNIFRLAQQACEKIDRTRGHAAQTFATILFERFFNYFNCFIKMTSFIPSC